MQFREQSAFGRKYLSNHADSADTPQAENAEQETDHRKLRQTRQQHVLDPDHARQGN